MEGNQTLRIVILGKTGFGKSSLANTLCGEKDRFENSSAAISKTKECCTETTEINGRNIRLIDTPGLFDTDLNTTDLSADILRCIEECAPGPHAFLLVLKVERYTKQEQDVVDIILQRFSDEALKYTTVVFTHGEDLSGGKNIKDWATQNEALKSLLEKCGGRCHVFDNKYWNDSQDPYRNNQVQVRELVNTIEETMREKNWKYYTNKFLVFLFDIIKEKWPVLKCFTASDLLGALLGVEQFAKALYERINQSARPPTDEDTGLYQLVQDMETLRILLLGKTGSGKSSLANTIFGDRDCFRVSSSASSSTQQCQSETRQVEGRNVQLVDAPGLFDTDLSSSNLRSELLKCLTECAPGPHAFLLVLRVERFTRQEQTVTDLILKHFSKEALKFIIVVFTHGDNLRDEMRVEEWVDRTEALMTLVQKCGGRCHVFDNKYWNDSQDPYRNNQVQVRELLNTIERTVRENGGGYFTNEMLQVVEEETEEQAESIRRGSNEQRRSLFHRIRDWF